MRFLSPDGYVNQRQGMGQPERPVFVDETPMTAKALHSALVRLPPLALLQACVVALSGRPAPVVAAVLPDVRKIRNYPA